MGDLRTKKTELAIQNAFVELVLEDGFQAITITQLAQKAMINRQTFYKHYLDKYDLANQLTNNILAWYDNLAAKRVSLFQQGVTFRKVVDTLRPYLQALIDQYRRPIQALRTINLGPRNLDELLKDRIGQIVASLLDNQPSKFEQAIIESIILGLINYVIEAGTIPATDEILASAKNAIKLFE